MLSNIGMALTSITGMLTNYFVETRFNINKHIDVKRTSNKVNSDGTDSAVAKADELSSTEDAQSTESSESEEMQETQYIASPNLIGKEPGWLLTKKCNARADARQI